MTLLVLLLFVSCAKQESSQTTVTTIRKTVYLTEDGNEVVLTETEEQTVKAETPTETTEDTTKNVVEPQGHFIKNDEGIVLEKDLTGKYSSGEDIKDGDLKFSIRLVDDEVFIELKENGEALALSTLNSVSEQFTIVIKNDAGETRDFWGCVVKNSQKIYNTIEVEYAFDWFTKNKALEIEITCNSGSYSLGLVDTSSIEALRYDRTKYDEILSLMEKEDYIGAITELNSLDSDSFKFYQGKDMIESCKDSIYQRGFKLYLSQEYQSAANEMETILGYKDSSTIYKDCYYELGKTFLESTDYVNAADAFKKAGNYEDSKSLYSVACDGIYNDASALFDEGKYEDAMNLLNKLLDYSATSRAMYAQCRTKLGINVTYSIGSVGPAGGYIFYDCDADNNSGNADGLISAECGWRYLEATPEDLNTLYKFCDYKTSFGDTIVAVGKGKENTEKIVKTLGSQAYAAYGCTEYTFNGFDDWFLPSKNELNLMYINLHKEGAGFFANDTYWSSSWDDLLWGGYGWAQSFENGYKDTHSQTHSYKVRPIRAFSICSDGSTEHDWDSAETKPATCTSYGEITYTCKKCGLTKQEFTDSFGEHTYTNYECTACGKVEYQIGDTGPAGGIVVYDCGNTTNGWRFMEAYLDPEVATMWGRYRKSPDGDTLYVNGTTTYDSNCTKIEFGTGRENTEKLVAAMGDTAYVWTDSAEKETTSDYASQIRKRFYLKWV